jgi:ubiquinone/menaquinone biosynthesis C-methylase UbiE
MTDIAALPGITGLGRDRALGRAVEDTARLIEYANVFRAMTRRMLVDAGIASGMRVLTLESGVGDVALLAAELVGPVGEVVGIHDDPATLDIARTRAAMQRYPNIGFLEGNVESVDPPGMFDMFVGRFVLMYQPDPVQTIRRFLPSLRSGGSIAFLEADYQHGAAGTQGPILQEAIARLLSTLHQVGAESRMGPKLYQTMIGAGLPAPMMIAESIVGAPDRSPVPMILAETLRSVMLAMLQLGIVTEADLDVDTLERRIRAEAAELGDCLAAPSMISAWSRVP